MAARVDVLFCFRCEWWAEAGCGPRGPEPACPRCATPLYLVGPPGRRRAASRPDPRGSPPDPAAAPPQAGGLRALPPPRLLHTSARERWAGPGSVDVEVDVEVDGSEAEPPDDEEEVGGPFGVRAALVAVVGVLLAVAVLAPREPPPEPDPSPPAAAAPRLAPAAGPPATALVPASLRTLADAFGVRGLVFVGPEDSPRLTGDRPAGNRIWRIDLETGVVQRGPAVPAIVEIRADPRSGGERLLALSRGGTLLSTTMDPHERPARVSGDVVSFAIRKDGTVLVARAVQGDPPSGWDAAARVAVTPVRADDGMPVGRASRVLAPGLSLDDVVVHPGRVLVSGTRGDGPVAVWSAEGIRGGRAAGDLVRYRLPTGFSVRRVVAWSPDGRLLAVTGATSDGGRLGLFLLRPGSPGLLLRWADRRPLGATFSDDSRLLTWIENDSLFVLHVETGLRHAVRLPGILLPAATRLGFA